MLHIFVCNGEIFCSFVSTFQHCEKSKKQVPEGLEKRSKVGFVCTISVTFGENKSLTLLFKMLEATVWFSTTHFVPFIMPL